MTSFPGARAVSSLLVVTLIAASASFLFLPQRATAAAGVSDTVHVLTDTSPTSLFDLAKNTISAAANVVTSNSALGLNIKEYVLDPVIRIVAQMALKSLTASIVGWISGKGNSGTPSFVQNLGKYLLSVGDTTAIHFFAEISSNSNSPFAPGILSSLRNRYLQTTSAAGFWAANSCNLSQSSPDIKAFVGGDFSKGGYAAWFGLTQPQNNPLSLYNKLDAELRARVNQAQGQSSARLGFSQGFFSWCGDTPEADSSKPLSIDDQLKKNADITVQSVRAQTGPYSSGAVGSTCTNKDGSSGIVKTPGSVIHDQLSKSLGSSIDSLVSAHEIDEMVDAIFGALVSRILGGGGLAGASTASVGGRSITSDLENSNSLNATSTGAGGSTQTVGNNLSGTLSNYVSQYQIQVSNYHAAWASIGNAASQADTATKKVLACEVSHNTPGSYGAQAALDTLVTPAVAKATDAATIAATASAAATKAIGEISTASTTDSFARAAADVQNLQQTPPSIADTTNAEGEANILDSATADSDTSLAVSGGTLIDRLRLLTKNAGSALSACESAVPRII